MDHGFKALIGVAGTHVPALQLFELAKAVFDQMPSFVHFGVGRDRLGATWVLLISPDCFIAPAIAGPRRTA